MRKICSILLLFSVFMIGVKTKKYANSYNDSVTYAKIQKGCNLYKTKDMNADNFDEVYFELPETYFVVILEFVNDYCYKVQYDKFVGYIQASFVKPVTFIPKTKTLFGVTCDIKSKSGTQIWSKPTSNADVLTTVSAGSKGINYIASCSGLIPTGGQSNVWYYVSYTPVENSTSVFEGYIYSENVERVSDIVVNLENNPEEIIESANENDKSMIFISSTIKTLIITVVSIPVILFFVIILYKIVKLLQKYTNKKKFEDKKIFDKSAVFKEDERVNIEKFKHGSFIKLSRNKTHLPSFPNYENEDDLL